MSGARTCPIRPPSTAAWRRFRSLVNLKAAHDALGPHDSLEGLTIGVRFTIPGLRVVPQPHQAQYVLYDVPDDVAARFDCASRLTPGSPAKVSHAYGHHFGTTFRIAGPRKATSIALLWAKEDGYWKIVSWQTEPDADETPAPPAPPEPDGRADQGRPRARQRGEELSWTPG